MFFKCIIILLAGVFKMTEEGGEGEKAETAETAENVKTTNKQMNGTKFNFMRQSIST